MNDETANRQLDELRRSLSIPTESLSVDDVFPVIVPSAFFESGMWPGPYSQLRLELLAVTWAILRPQNTMLYVNQSNAEYWESKGLAWREQSMGNLERVSEDDLASHRFHRPDGTAFALVMMHDDGIGPSRLLLDGYISNIFPEGYRVAVPERSVGIVLRGSANQEERVKIENVVLNCFNVGTVPVSPDFFNADGLLTTT